MKDNIDENKMITLKENFEFQRIYNRGKSYVSRNVVLYLIKNNKKINRIGITASKKIGNAVNRNRAKRLIKEGYRLDKDNLKIGYDMVFVARVMTTKSKQKYVSKDLNYIFKKSDLYK